MTERRDGRPADDARGELLQRMLLRAVETMQLGVTVTDPDGTIRYVNPAEERLHGWPPGELIGKDIGVFAPGGNRRPMTREQLKASRGWARETGNRRRDGSVFPAKLLSDVVLDEAGEPLGVVTTCEDATARRDADAALVRIQAELERKVLERTAALSEANAALHAEIADNDRVERALRASELRYRRLFERNLAGVYRSSLEGRFLDANDSFARMLGYASRDELLPIDAASLFPEPVEREAFLAKLTEKGSLSNEEHALRRQDGRLVWVIENVSLLPGEEAGPSVLEGTAIDISDRKRAEEQLLYDAFHDALTGLANRALFLDRLDVVARRARRHRTAFAVLFVDLDRFKLVNDSLGHVAGDRLLAEMASRLTRCVRAEDTVARLGGDEFILLLDEIEGIPEATGTAERILAACALPFDLNGQEVFSSASIGIAFGTGGLDDPEDLLRDADTAMYRAKALGKGRFEVFDEPMRARVQQTLELETDLRHALERNELRVHYQPIVALESGATIGFEALIRWQHPQKGLLPPATFISLAEETGLIVPIGQWVLETAARQLADWQRRFPSDPPLSMSVNLSSRQLLQPELVQRVADVIREAGIVASTLTLEITESILIGDPESAAAVLARLSGVGVGLSIDDFGTGYSSLSYLHRFPVGKLKIDQSFVSTMNDSPRNAEIVRTIAELAATLGLELIAEGVETRAQRDGLRLLNCSFGQGFLFATPLAAGEIERRLAAP